MASSVLTLLNWSSRSKRMRYAPSGTGEQDAQIKASGYGGSYTCVTDYIRAWRTGADKDAKAFVPLKSSWLKHSSSTGAKKAW